MREQGQAGLVISVENVCVGYVYTSYINLHTRNSVRYATPQVGGVHGPAATDCCETRCSAHAEEADATRT